MQIGDERKMSLWDVREKIREIESEQPLIPLHNERLRHNAQRRLELLRQIERSPFMSDDNVKPEFTFADDGNGYRIDIKGTVWHQDHSAWVSMVRGDGKRLYIQDMTPSDGVIVHGLVQRWERWMATGEVEVKLDGTVALPEANCDGHAFAPVSAFAKKMVDEVYPIVAERLGLESNDPWNEMGPFRIHDNGTVECIDIGVIVSAVAKPPYPPGRSYHVTFRSDSGNRYWAL